MSSENRQQQSPLAVARSVMLRSSLVPAPPAHHGVDRDPDEDDQCGQQDVVEVPDRGRETHGGKEPDQKR